MLSYVVIVPIHPIQRPPYDDRTIPHRNCAMPRKAEPSGKCTICAHPQRYQIELAIVSGVSRRAIGKKYTVSADAVWRHAHNHVPPERRSELVAGPLKPSEMAQRAADEGMTLLEYVAMVRNSLMARFLAASEADDRNGTALIAGRLLDCLRFSAQLSGELSKAGATVTTNIAILQSPLMADLQSMLIRTLSPYPDARAAVLRGLEELSARSLQAAPLPASSGRLIEGTPNLEGTLND